MATRALIVSDEPARQIAANDALARACPDWQFSLATSPVEALELLRCHPCDIVVCDLRQPETVGAQFLNEISRQYPGVLRAITGEPTEREMISQFVLCPHHFLPKHLNSDDLCTELTRAMTLDRWLGSEQMRTLVAQVRTFPSVPSRYFEVLKELRNEHPSTSHLGKIIASDMAMYTKIIQVLSSPFYAIPRQITDSTEAVTILGFEMIKSLVLCIQVFSQFDANKLPVATVDTLWGHSTRVAQAARKIALFEKADRRTVDDAFTAGLLHDVGKLILISNFPDQCRELNALSRENGEPMSINEKQIFGVTHGEISAYLLVTWGMPLPLGEAVAYHHHPSRSAESAFSALCAVHMADALIQEIEPETGSIHLPIDEPYLSNIGMSGRSDLWRELLQGREVTKPEPAPKALAEEVPPPLQTAPPTSQLADAPVTLVQGMVRRMAFWKRK